jgi:flagellar biosynthetic protein FliR
LIRDLVLSLAMTFALIVTRMGVFVAVSPVPGAAIPTETRVGLTLLLAVAATPLAPPVHGLSFGPSLVVAAFGEAMTGAAIGFVFRVGMSASEVLGSSLAHATGLTFASTYDPTQAGQSDALTRIVSTAAMLVMFAVGAHRVIIGAAVGSLRVVPVGGMIDLATYMPGILTWVRRSLECGLGLAVPAMTISLIVQVAIGLVARAAPALQVFSVGLSVSLASGLVVVLSGMGDSMSGVAAHLLDLGPVLERVIAPAR